MKRSLAKRPLHFPFKAVQLARPFVDAAPPPWPWQHLFDAWTSEFSKQGFPIFKLPDRHIGNDGSETIAIEIRWGYFTNKEISEEMRKFACAHRPGNEACKEPKRKGQRPKAVIQSHLKALSVMRIWKLHNRNQWKRLTTAKERGGSIRPGIRCKMGAAFTIRDLPLESSVSCRLIRPFETAFEIRRKTAPLPSQLAF